MDTNSKQWSGWRDARAQDKYCQKQTQQKSNFCKAGEMTADGSYPEKTTGYITGLAFLPKWQAQKNGFRMYICSTLAGELSQVEYIGCCSGKMWYPQSTINSLKCITCIFKSLTVNSVPWKEFNWLLQDLLETRWGPLTHNYWHALLTSTFFG